MATVKQMTPQEITDASELVKLARVGRAIVQRRANIAGTVAAKIEKLAGSLVDNEFSVGRIQHETNQLVLQELDLVLYQAGLGPDPRD